ncbi:MAG: hypothetical protein JXQ99_10465 [Hyphomicrobiaceae bacterium]
MLNNTLIAPTGASFDAYTHWQSQDLARCMSLASYVDYACRNLGYIAIERHPRAVCVSMRPCAIDDTGEISMLYQLAELNRSHRHVLRIFDREWTHTILPNFNELLSELQRLRAATLQPDNFIRQTVAPDDTSVPENLQKMIGAWRENGIDINRNDDREEYVSSLCDQFLVVRRPKQGGMYFEGHGKGVYAVLGGIGLAPFKGRSLTSTANQNYVAKASQAYLRAFEQQHPILEKVDALSCMNGNRTLERLRYWRLLLPQQLGNGDALLISSSVDDQSINLRQDSI